MFGIPTHLLAKVTITENTTDVTLSVNPIVIAALSFTPRHLLVRINAFSDETGDGQTVKMRFNGDSGDNYNQQQIKAVGGTDTATVFNSRADIPLYDITDTANALSGGEVLIPDALSTRSHKSSVGQFGKAEEGVYLITGRWANTAAITSVTMLLTTGNFDTGSTFELCVVDESYAISGAEDILTGSQSSFSQGSITAGTGNLVCIGNLRTDRGSATQDGLKLHYNSDTTSGNYYMQRLYGNGTNENAATGNNDVGFTALATSADASAFSTLLYTIPNYSDGSNDRTALAISAQHATSGTGAAMLHARRWNNTAGITAISLIPEIGSNFVANSMFSLYLIPGGSGDEIERQELGADTATITFSDIPQTYDHLELSVYARNARSGTQTLAEIALNADATDANYNTQALYAINTTITAEQQAGSSSARRTIETSGATATANVYGGGTLTLYNYTKTDRHKHYLAASGIVDVESNNAMRIYSGRWENTAAITSIVMTTDSGDDFIAGSVFQLRGINPPAAAATDIETINGITAANIEAVN